MSKARPPGVLAKQIVKIFVHRNPHPLGLPRSEVSRQQLRVLLDDRARLDSVDRMRQLVRGLAPWLGDQDIEEMIRDSVAGGRRWDMPDEIKVLAELFQLSEQERDGLGIRAVRPVDAAGTALDDAAMLARRRVAKKLYQQKCRLENSKRAQAQTAAAAPALSPTELLIYEKIDLTWRSTTIIAKAVRRSHQFEGQKRNLSSIRKAILRASEKLAAAGLIEMDSIQKGGNGQPLRLLRRLIVHAKSVSETPRHAQNDNKNRLPKMMS